MTGIIVKRFGQTKEIREGVYPLFGFAVHDYIAKYNLKPEDVEKMYIWGAILEEEDERDEMLGMLDVLTISDNLALFIFDINSISDEFVGRLRELFEQYEQFEELKDCYEGRIVFGRLR